MTATLSFSSDGREFRGHGPLAPFGSATLAMVLNRVYLMYPIDRSLYLLLLSSPCGDSTLQRYFHHSVIIVAWVNITVFVSIQSLLTATFN